MPTSPLIFGSLNTFKVLMKNEVLLPPLAFYFIHPSNYTLHETSFGDDKQFIHHMDN